MPLTIDQLNEQLKTEPVLVLAKADVVQLLTTRAPKQKDPQKTLSETLVLIGNVDGKTEISQPLLADVKPQYGLSEDVKTPENTASEDVKVTKLKAEKKILTVVEILDWIETEFKSELKMGSKKNNKELKPVVLDAKGVGVVLRSLKSFLTLREKLNFAMTSREWKYFFLPQTFRTNFEIQEVNDDKSDANVKSDIKADTPTLAAVEMQMQAAKKQEVNPIPVDNLEPCIKFASINDSIVIVNTAVLLSHVKAQRIPYVEFNNLLRPQASFVLNRYFGKICEDKEQDLVERQEGSICCCGTWSSILGYIGGVAGATVAALTKGDGQIIAGIISAVLLLLALLSCYKVFKLHANEGNIDALIPDRQQKRDEFTRPAREDLKNVLVWLGATKPNSAALPSASAGVAYVQHGDVKIDISDNAKQHVAVQLASLSPN